MTCQRFVLILGQNHVILQVLNTDAEGRLTLADALVYAEKNCGAEAIIDVATLTGACMVALGTSMCGMFSPNQQLVSQLKQAGSKSGDSPCCSDAETHYFRSVGGGFYIYSEPARLYRCARVVS